MATNLAIDEKLLEEALTQLPHFSDRKSIKIISYGIY